MERTAERAALSKHLVSRGLWQVHAARFRGRALVVDARPRTELLSCACQPNKCRFTKAGRAKLASRCKLDNSLGNDFAYYFRLAAVVKLFAGGVKSFAHSRNRLRVKHPVLYEGNN